MHIEIKNTINQQRNILKKLENIGLSKKKYKKYKELFFNGTLSPEQENELLKILEKKHKCEKEIKEYYNNNKQKEELLRQIANLQNKIMLLQKEQQLHLENQEEKIIKSMLPILDTLEIALEHIENKNDPLVIGIENTIKKFYSTLENYGIKPVKHEEFNPEIHQAISIDNDETKPKNTITKIHQKGFIKNNKKLIRPSMVSVNK